MEKAIKIGMVGCGHRGIVGFLESLKNIGHAADVVALCDHNRARLDFSWEILGNEQCQRYLSFEEFLQHPEMTTVIVSTPDSTHVDFVNACFAAGKDVVCEKPMATSVEDCRKMIQAQGENQFRVAFNLRYNSVIRQVKQLLVEGRVGTILQVESHDIVSWQHGSDYFRRWHRFMEKSGGLLVHKSTHNFDVINWWVDAKPQKVVANACKSFFLPHLQKGENCTECDHKDSCKFYIDINEDVPGQFAGIPEFYKKMYVEGKQYDGYVRDACVFHRDNDVCDTYNVLVTYPNQVFFNYTAVFYAPYEDRHFMIQGTEGRIEVSQRNRLIKVFNNESVDPEIIEVPVESGGHDGADVNLMKSLYQSEDDLQLATAEDGYWSVAIAANANTSIATGDPLEISGI